MKKLPTPGLYIKLIICTLISVNLLVNTNLFIYLLFHSVLDDFKLH